MQNKLQELTDKLYNEGLSKGKEEGEVILAKAKAQANEIVANAQKEAEAIVAKAQKDAEGLKDKVNGDLKMASNLSLNATKHEIETLIISKIADLQVNGALASADFFKEIIKTVAQKFSAEESKDIALILPESMKVALEPFVKNELSQVLGGSVEVTFSKKISGGLNIGPKDGSYFISLTDETFKSLISNYLRPITRKFLFGA